jgi:hypothetical protein
MLSVVFPPTYDEVPPSVSFQTIPFHPNVDASTGRVCMDVLDPKAASSSFAPRVGLQTVLVMLQALLDNPVLTDAVNAEAAHIYLNTPRAYAKASAHLLPSSYPSQIAQQCVEAMRRVQEGKVPPNAVDQDDFLIHEALHKTQILSDVPKQEVNLERTKPPVVSFDTYFASWSQLATTQSSSRKTQPTDTASRTTTKHERNTRAPVQRTERHADSDEDDKDAEELCQWTATLPDAN